MNMLRTKRQRHLFRIAVLSLVVGMLSSIPIRHDLNAATAVQQQVDITGRVTDAATGEPLAGVGVRVTGTNVQAVTDAEGYYTLSAPAQDVLVFTFIGYRSVAVDVAGRMTIDVSLVQSIAVLQEVVVTGYTTQRRADITGAVASADIQSIGRQTGASVLKRLDGRVAGVTVDASGAPGSRSTVRIRGFSSFQNNDPLYIIDGTPIQDTYLGDGGGPAGISWLNPDDIESIQVLKDASAASIYGSRANNGVVIIETKKGRAGAPQVSVNVRTGVATPVRGYDDILILDALEYHQFLKRSFESAGLPVPTNIYGDPNNPSVPAYIWPNDGVNQTTTADESAYEWGNQDNIDAQIMPGSTGTNWWDAVFGPAFVGDFNMNISGGSEDTRYNVSFNYLNQEGTAAFSRFQRGTVRVNTEFDLGRLTVGENFAISFDHAKGNGEATFEDPDGFAEDGVIGKNILMQPVVPVYDIRGNFASAKSIANQSNPLKIASASKDDIDKNTRIVGNVFATVGLFEGLSATTRLGFNLNDGSSRGFSPIFPENREPTYSNAINENNSRLTDWTWSNTLNYAGTFDQHSVAVLVGQEANEVNQRYFEGSMSNLLSTDISARYLQPSLGDAETINATSVGSTGSLLSFFGKVDYNFADKYYLGFTLRRDGSSRLGPGNRWGTFPAVGGGWRLSEESFLAGSPLFTNLMLRFGWGVTGNQSIPAGRILSQFGGDLDDVFYAIGGGNAIVQGFTQTSLGNDSLKWEENTSINVGLDLELAGSVYLILDVYQRSTDNLLFNPAVPATAGVASPAFVNIGEMRNRGFDLSIGYRADLGTDGSWGVKFNGTRYRNKIVRIDGVSKSFFQGEVDFRQGGTSWVINQVGHPMGSFYGWVADGLFMNQAEVDAHAQQDGAAPGRIRFKDISGPDGEPDGVINADDNTIIGSPHPDFTAGLDLEFRWKDWDFGATLFGTFGNEILDLQKDFYIFADFNTNVRRDRLTKSAVVENGQVTNPDAEYPRIDESDEFSRNNSSFWVEDGSYVRLRNLQIGYTLPKWVPGLRVYVQAENLFTITGYPGLDPALPAAQITSGSGDIRDQFRGVDRGAYPANRTISFGINATFSAF